MHGFSSDDEGVDLLASILDGEKLSLSGQEVKRTTRTLYGRRAMLVLLVNMGVGTGPAGPAAAGPIFSKKKKKKKEFISKYGHGYG